MVTYSLKVQYGLICPHVVIIFQNSFICRDMTHFAQYDYIFLSNVTPHINIWIYNAQYSFMC